MRKWDHGSGCKEDSATEDLEGGLTNWWMAIGGALRWRKFPVSSEGIPKEGNGSLERERESGLEGRPGEQSQCREHTWSESGHQNVRNNAACKESSQEKSHVQEQGLMAGLNCQTGRVKMAQCWLWARHGFYRRGSLKKLAHAWESPLGVGLS
jgi:hypothetical protein